MDQPVVESTYISNPFKMISPSANALTLNIGTLLAMLGLQLSPLLAILVALPIIMLGQGSQVANFIGFTIGFVACVALIVFALLSLPTYTVILLASVRKQKVSLRSAISQARPFIWPMLGLAILTMLAVIGGIILFVIPGLIFSAWFALSGYVMVAEKLGAVASMKRSHELVRGRVWEIWSLNVLPSIFYAIPIFGSLINFVMSIILLPALGIRYQQATSVGPQNRPAVHWTNYLVPILMVLVYALVVIALLSFTSGSSSTLQSTPTYSY